MNAVPFRVNVLLFDCEGCIETVFANTTVPEMKEMLAYTRVIIVEGDMSVLDPSCKLNCVDYTKWIRIFEKLGFTVYYEIVDSVFQHILHFVLIRNKNKLEV